MKRQHHHEPSRANDDEGDEKKKRQADEPSRANYDDGDEKKKRRADEPSRANSDDDEVKKRSRAEEQSRDCEKKKRRAEVSRAEEPSRADDAVQLPVSFPAEELSRALGDLEFVSKEDLAGDAKKTKIEEEYEVVNKEDTPEDAKETNIEKDYVEVDKKDIPEDPKETNNDESLLSRFGRGASYKYDELCNKYPEVTSMLKELPEAVGFPLSSAFYAPALLKQIFDLSKRPESEASETISSTFKTMASAAVVFTLVCLVKREFTLLAALSFVFNQGFLKSSLMTGPAKEEELAKAVESLVRQAEEEKKAGKVDEPDLTEEQLTDLLKRYSHYKREKEAAEAFQSTGKVDAPVKGSGEASATKTPWTFWLAEKTESAEEETAGVSSVSRLDTFKDVSEGFGIYNSLKMTLLGKSPEYYELYCFKRDIEPRCCEGLDEGKWTMPFCKGESDSSWRKTLQALIRDDFEHGDDICGATVKVTSDEEEIALWTKNAANKATQESIGKQWKGFLESTETIRFKSHEHARQDESSANPGYTV